MQFYTIQPCKTTAAIECIPKKQLNLNFDKLEKVFSKNIEITIYKSGKLLIKQLEIAKKLQRKFIRLFSPSKN